MEAAQIKNAINEGKNVYWKNTLYKVVKDGIGQFLITCTLNSHCIGLTNQDGTKLNGNEMDFFIA